MTPSGFQLAKWASDLEDGMKEIPDYQRSRVTKIEFKDDKKFQKSLGVIKLQSKGRTPLISSLMPMSSKVELKENLSVSWLRFIILWDY